jgi:hypothetical protein
MLLLGACGEERASQPTAEQADQLNEAEELLNREAGVEEPSGGAAQGT